MLCASNLRLQPMNRWKAAILHAVASLLLVAAITAIVVPLWHPWELYGSPACCRCWACCWVRR